MLDRQSIPSYDISTLDILVNILSRNDWFSQTCHWEPIDTYTSAIAQRTIDLNDYQLQRQLFQHKTKSSIAPLLALVGIQIINQPFIRLSCQLVGINLYCWVEKGYRKSVLSKKMRQCSHSPLNFVFFGLYRK